MYVARLSHDMGIRKLVCFVQRKKKIKNKTLNPYLNPFTTHPLTSLLTLTPRIMSMREAPRNKEGHVRTGLRSPRPKYLPSGSETGLGCGEGRGRCRWSRVEG